MNWKFAATLLVALFAAITPASSQVIGQSGAIRGSVHDRDFDVPLARARVTLVEALLATGTNADGQFLFERVPPGTYTLSVTKDGYERQIVTSVVVAPGQIADVHIDLESEVFDMEELVVKGEDLLGNTEVGLLELRAESTSIQDAVSSELISKAGVSDAAGALKLVVGATVAEGKYATVRGLSDRYTGTTLNGVRLPSADPRKRAVNIDIFPTGTIESMTVTKTFTPDMQGDFTGGVVNIETKSVPDQTSILVSIGGEYNMNATGNDQFLTYKGGGITAFGFDDGDRSLPSDGSELPQFPRFSANPTPENALASAQYDGFTKSFQPVIGTTEDAPGPNGSLSVLYGDKKDFEKAGTLGWITALTYSNRYGFYENGTNNTAYVAVAGEPLTVAASRIDSQGSEELLIGFLGSLTYRPTATNELTLRLVGNQSADDDARLQVEAEGRDLLEQNQSLQYTERSLASYQLSGNHRLEKGIGGAFGAPSFGWKASYNDTRQYQPDVRFFRNIFDKSNQTATTPSNSTEPQNTRRIWRDIDEQNTQGALDVDLPFTQWTESAGKVKTGLYYESSARDYTQNSFSYTFPRQDGPFSNPQRLENLALASYTVEGDQDLWTNVFLESDRTGLATNNPPAPNQLLWTLVPIPRSDTSYTGDQTIEAAYAMAELPVWPSVTLIGGARWESTAIAVAPFNDFGFVEAIVQDPVSGSYGIVPVRQEEAAANVNEDNWLPSLGVVWEIVPNMRLRASWTETVARPTFRELAPVASEEFIFGDEFVGNPDLVLSSIRNRDLRWEWFRRPGDVLAVSIFTKDLTDPIEYINFSAGGRTFIQPINYDSGSLRGFELEARLGLDVLSKALAGLTFGVNFTWLDSEVAVPTDQKALLVPYQLDEPTRPLQGQPDSVVNVNLTYDNDQHRISAGIFYNRVGQTLLSGAAVGQDGGTPDVFQQPIQILDATFEKTFKHSVRLLFKAKNLLAPEAESVYLIPQGVETTKSKRETARVFGVTVGWSY